MSEKYECEDPVWQKGEMQKPLAKQCEQERAAALEVKTDVEAFRNLHSALSRNGPLNVDSLLKVAGTHNIKATKEDIAAIFAKYDANQNADLELKEFAAWWGTATDGLSVLLRNALSEAILAPGTVEQWKRGNCIRFDMTSGNVDDSFEAKSGIYVTVVPSSEESVKELAAESGNASAAASSATGESPDLVPQGVASATFSVKDGASDEEVQQLIDLVNVVSDEMTSANPEKAPFKLVLSKGFEQGKRVLKVSGTLLNVPKDPSAMVNHLATLAGLKGAPLFKKIVVGVEFGCDGDHVFAPMPKGAVAELFENLRLTAQVDYDDALLKLLTVLSLQPDGLDEDALPKLLASSFLARGARSVHLTSNFRSHKEVVDSLVDSVSKIPFTKRTARDNDELYAQAMASAIIRMRLEQVMGMTQLRSTLVYSLPIMDMFYGEVPEPCIFNVIGLPGSGKSTLIEKLGAEANGPYFNKMQVSFQKKPGKQYVMFAKNDGMIAKGEKVIAVIDASSEERLAESLRLVSVGITSSDELSPDSFFFVVTKSNSSGDAVSFENVKKTLGSIVGDEDEELMCLQFDGTTVPEKLTEAIEGCAEEQEDPEDEKEGGGDDDDEDEEGPSMQAIAKKAFKGASKCLSGLQEIEFTNSIVSAHIVMNNLPFANALGEVDPEKIRRNRIEFGYRFQNITEYGDSLNDISEIAQSWAPLETDDDEGAAKKKNKTAPRKRRVSISDDDSDDYGCDEMGSSECSSD